MGSSGRYDSWMTRCGILSPDGLCDVLLYRLFFG